jgi:hypothetical protein
MIESLKRLFSPEYLVVTEPGPLGGAWVLYLALGLLFSTGLACALWILAGQRPRQRSLAQRAWAWYELWICLAGLGTVAGRFLGWPGWSARIWPYTLAALATIGVIAYRLRGLQIPGWLEDQLRTLALASPPPGRAQQPSALGQIVWRALGLGLHLGGLALVLTQRYHLPAWTAPLALVALLMPQAPLLARGHRLWLPALAPMLGAYVTVLLWLLYRGTGMTIIGWQGLAFPNPMTSLFYVDGILLGAVAFTFLCNLSTLARAFSRQEILWRGAIAALLAATLAWAGVVYFGKRTHGATASDPFAYAQMAVDLAERGTFLHRYSLFEDVMPLDIAWAPLQPVGYHIPRNELGDSPSVWATGASALLAAGYGLLGELGLYVTTPVVALLALAATWALVQETLHGAPRPARYLAGALAVALLATSTEHVDRLLVPMADAPAQLFTVLTLLFSLRGMHQLQAERRSLWSFLLAGFCFAWAFWVRHTQLVLALPVVLAAILGAQRSQPGAGGQRSESAAHRRSAAEGHVTSLARWQPATLSLLVFFTAALLAALPDIAYRWRHFGGPLATETTELPLMALRFMGPVAWQMLRDVLVAGEWGYLFPLVLYGGYRLVRNRSREAVVLGSAFLAVLLVHLTYRSLRLRDLISLFPLVNLAAASGAVMLAHLAHRFAPRPEEPGRLGRLLLPTVLVAWIVLSLALSRWAMIDNLWKPGWASFGYVRSEQRAAFDRLSALTPPEAVIGASLNAGAIMMYTGRDAIRPYDSWTEQEWHTFLDAMQARGRSIYLLDDGELMAEFIDEKRDQHQLVPIAELEVPIFYTRDRGTGWLYHLEWEQ